MRRFKIVLDSNKNDVNSTVVSAADVRHVLREIIESVNWASRNPKFDGHRLTEIHITELPLK